MSLGDDLCADQDVDLMGHHAVDEISGGARPRQGVACHDGDARLRQDGRRFLGDAFDPRTAGGEYVGLAARRAVRRAHPRMATMMALQPAGVAMLNKPGLAVRAFEAVAATSAQGERRVAAAIEE